MSAHMAETVAVHHHARPHNLPPQPTSLVGRAWELQNIVTLAARPDVRLLTLTGPGGTGKTRLALQAATTLLPSFPHGAWFVALEAVDAPQLVAPAVAQALGVKETGDRPLVARLQEYLRERALLLVLDNCEHVLGAAPMLRDLLDAAPGVTLLATSRAPLRLAYEREYPVPPLSLPDLARMPAPEQLLAYESVRLFVDRTQAARPGFALSTANAPAIAEICRRLDGLPLAIELAAARTRLFPPQALLARLSRPLDILTSGARDLPARQQTLRAAIEWSYTLLAPHEQRLFRWLSVFVGGCTIEAAEAVGAGHAHEHGGVGPQPGALLDDLTALIDHSLLRQADLPDGSARLSLLETIREYALEQLAASGDEQAARREHAAYFLALAEGAQAQLQGPAQGAWLALLEREQANLRAATEWARIAAPEQALRMAAALWRFCEMRGLLSQGRDWLRDALAAAPGAPASLRAGALSGAGALATLQSDFAAATVALDQALALYQQLNDQRGTAYVWRYQGLLRWFEGHQAEAYALLTQSAALFRQLGDRWGLADALHFLGHVVFDQGDAAATSAIFAESLALFRATGDQRNIALPLKDLGLIASQQGDHARAAELYHESLALSRAVEDTWHIADTLQRLGDLARMRGDHLAANTIYGESLEIWRRLGHTGGIAEALNLLGEVALAQGHDDQAAAHLEASLATLRALGSQRMTAAVLHNLGWVALRRGDRSGAGALLAESLALNQAIDYLPGQADCLIGMAALALADGDAARAVRLLAPAQPHLASARGFMPLNERPSYEAALASARAALGAHGFERAWADGQALALEQAVALALGRELGPSHHQATPAANLERQRRDDPLGELTSREIEVLRLVAQGLTDAQVAARLVISPRTVNGHLRSIYGKLGVASRTAAAHYAASHHLIGP